MERTDKATVSDDLGLLQCLVWGAQGHDRWKHTRQLDGPVMVNHVVSKRSELALRNWNYVCVLF